MLPDERHSAISKKEISHCLPIDLSVEKNICLPLYEKPQLLTAEPVSKFRTSVPVSTSHIFAVLSAAPVSKNFVSPRISC